MPALGGHSAPSLQEKIVDNRDKPGPDGITIG
jgi:hypothetical protein